MTFGDFGETLPPAAASAMAAADAMTPSGARALLDTLCSGDRCGAVQARIAPAIVAAESSWNASARGPGGEYGLAQLTLATARGLGFNGHPLELMDPGLNLRLMLRLLDELVARFGSDLARIASAYNCGPDRCRRADGSYTNQAYIDRVLGRVAGVPATFPPTSGPVNPSTAIPLAGLALVTVATWAVWRVFHGR